MTKKLTKNERVQLLVQGLKQCSHKDCKKIKHLFEFNSNKNKSDGYASWCKECRQKYEIRSSDIREETRIQRLSLGVKKCSKCKEVKDISTFSNDRSRGDGLNHRCKICDRIHVKNIGTGQRRPLRTRVNVILVKTKLCSYCNQEKDILEFRIDYSSPDGHLIWCKKCCDKFWKGRPPWQKTCKEAKKRCRKEEFYIKNGIQVLMTSADFKMLWFRDHVYEMEKPEIHRKKNHLNYTIENCEYKEHDDHQRLHREMRKKKND